MAECISCGAEIDREADAPTLSVSAYVPFKRSWKAYAVVHVECFTEAFGEGNFDAEAWAEAQ